MEKQPGSNTHETDTTADVYDLTAYAGDRVRISTEYSRLASVSLLTPHIQRAEAQKAREEAKERHPSSQSRTRKRGRTVLRSTDHLPPDGDDIA